MMSEHLRSRRVRPEARSAIAALLMFSQQKTRHKQADKAPAALAQFESPSKEQLQCGEQALGVTSRGNVNVDCYGD
jgi:hypothetical protein